MNLATNARDAKNDMGKLTLMAAEEVRRHATRISSPLTLDPGRYIRLSVTDIGCGMDAALLARVTEPFFTTKPPGKGTGLGLAMAKGFSEQSGDGIDIESAPGQGTTVHLYFPAATEAAPSPGKDWFAPQASLTGKNIRLLLVDDDAMVRDIVEAEMRDAGLVVTACASGREALAHLDRGEAVDVLVSDLSMPLMDGLTLIREAKRRKPSLPAILLTGFSTNIADITRNGEFDEPFLLLRKPITGNAIVERAASLLEEGQFTGSATAPDRADPSIETKEIVGMSNHPLRILVVEDEGLVAMVVEESLLGFGYEVAGPVDTTAKAMALLADGHIDGAVLDVNLGNERVDPVAKALAAASVPFIFATGYAARETLPEGFRDRIAIFKPYSEEDLENALRQVLGAAADQPDPIATRPQADKFARET